MVETSISGWHHFGFKITQTSVFLDFLKTVSDGNWSLKVHKNQCFINDQLKQTMGIVKRKQTIRYFRFPKTFSRWKLASESTQEVNAL